MANGRERLKANVAALDRPLVVLLEQDGANQAGEGRLVGEDADNVGAPLDADRLPCRSGVRRLQHLGLEAGIALFHAVDHAGGEEGVAVRLGGTSDRGGHR